MKTALKMKSPDRELDNSCKGKKDLRVSEHSPKELLVSQHGNVLVL